MVIKAIETFYKGYKFRSRLEARWAVFFDALGLEYQYEPEGFDLGDGIFYLPDFYLPKLRAWVEIKGNTPTAEEKEKIRRLNQHVGVPCFIFSGLPNEHKSYGWFWEIANSGGGAICSEDTICCSRNNSFGFHYTSNGDIPGFNLNYCEDRVVVDSEWEAMPHFSACFYPYPGGDAAATVAKQARFEHGQSGA
jgi:hypothetical protein